jgi:hypothetical protein
MKDRPNTILDRLTDQSFECRLICIIGTAETMQHAPMHATRTPTIQNVILLTAASLPLLAYMAVSLCLVMAAHRRTKSAGRGLRVRIIITGQCRRPPVVLKNLRLRCKDGTLYFGTGG